MLTRSCGARVIVQVAPNLPGATYKSGDEPGDADTAMPVELWPSYVPAQPFIKNTTRRDHQKRSYGGRRSEAQWPLPKLHAVVAMAFITSGTCAPAPGRLSDLEDYWLNTP